MEKQNKGITLITLVITIILLIILAGIGINMFIGQNSLLNKAKLAKQNYINAEKEEEKQINDLYSEILIATNDDAKVTMNIKELKQLINETVDSRMQSKGMYIDVENKLADIQIGVEYEANQDCIIAGYTQTTLNGKRTCMGVNIDGVNIGYYGGSNSDAIEYNLVYINIKKGQKILFNVTTGEIGNAALYVCSYATL